MSVKHRKAVVVGCVPVGVSVLMWGVCVCVCVKRKGCQLATGPQLVSKR